jgi:hypothetical protein
MGIAMLMRFKTGHHPPPLATPPPMAGLASLKADIER